MATLHLRNVEGGWRLGLKMAALGEGMTLREYCVCKLSLGLGGVDVAQSVADGGKVAKSSVVEPLLGKVDQVKQQVAKLSVPRPEHNSKTCTVYKCGMCAK